MSSTTAGERLLVNRIGFTILIVFCTIGFCKAILGGRWFNAVAFCGFVIGLIWTLRTATRRINREQVTQNGQDTAEK